MYLHSSVELFASHIPHSCTTTCTHRQYSVEYTCYMYMQGYYTCTMYMYNVYVYMYMYMYMTHPHVLYIHVVYVHVQCMYIVPVLYDVYIVVQVVLYNILCTVQYHSAANYHTWMCYEYYDLWYMYMYMYIMNSIIMATPLSGCAWILVC